MRAVDTALDATSSGSRVHYSVPDELVQQGNWETVRRHSHWLNRPSASRLMSQKSVNSQHIETLST